MQSDKWNVLSKKFGQIWEKGEMLVLAELLKRFGFLGTFHGFRNPNVLIQENGQIWEKGHVLSLAEFSSKFLVHGNVRVSLSK